MPTSIRTDTMMIIANMVDGVNHDYQSLFIAANMPDAAIALLLSRVRACSCEKLLLPRLCQCNIPKEGKDVEATLATRPLQCRPSSSSMAQHPAPAYIESTAAITVVQGWERVKGLQSLPSQIHRKSPKRPGKTILLTPFSRSKSWQRTQH